MNLISLFVSRLLLGFLLNRFHEEQRNLKALKDGFSRGTGEIATSSKDISQRSSTSRTEIAVSIELLWASLEPLGAALELRGGPS